MTMADLFPVNGDNGLEGSNGKPKNGKATKIHPSMDAATETIGRAKGATKATWWIYLDAVGKEAMAVARFDMPGGEKDYLPFHPVEGGWQTKDPKGKLPLSAFPRSSGQIEFTSMRARRQQIASTI